MEFVFDDHSLRGILCGLHALTGLRMGVYRPNLEEVLATPVEHSLYCALIRGTGAGHARCKACDHSAAARANAAGEVVIYTCHAGLAEAVAPIQDGDTTLGYLMFGQVRRQGSGPLPIRQLASELRLAPRELELASARLHEADDERIRNSAMVLQSCALAVLHQRFIRPQRGELATRLERYLEHRLSGPTDIATMSRELGVGKTTLCACARESFGTTLGKLIRRRRVEHAKKLLAGSSTPIAEIAADVGIPDYNYFSRLFKAETGMSPSAYRKAPKQPAATKQHSAKP